MKRIIFSFEACWLEIITYPSQNTEKINGNGNNSLHLISPYEFCYCRIFYHFFVFLLLFSHSLSGWKWHKNSTALFSLCSVHFWNKLLTFIVSSSQHIERLSVNIIKVLYLPLEGVRDEKIIHNELDFFSKHTLFFGKCNYHVDNASNVVEINERDRALEEHKIKYNIDILGSKKDVIKICVS